MAAATRSTPAATSAAPSTAYLNGGFEQDYDEHQSTEEEQGEDDDDDDDVEVHMNGPDDI